MNWSHICLIFQREIRDQLRDRRTMFTIAVLPLLLYPLMGLVMLQITQFNRVRPVHVTLVGYENWPTSKPLLESGRIAGYLVGEQEQGLIEFQRADFDLGEHGNSIAEQAEQFIRKQDTDLVVFVPPLFSERLEQVSSNENTAPEATADLQIFKNQANEQSTVANQRMRYLLECWQQQWVDEQLSAAELSPQLMRPLAIVDSDIAPPATRRALIWSKLMPFVMLVWALTGAFYPAVDLCAGEKERGTLETLLSSPARRCEIVWGKLLTVMTFSMGTAILNLVSMQVTASFVINQFARLGANDMLNAMGPLPVNAFGWLLMMLLPMSALFSAVALAVASLARSSKEGQYYLMPLLLIGLPLVMLPMMPGVHLSFGTSIIPVSGAVLLARTLIEGQFQEALLFLPIVVSVTFICCMLAVRWAVRQFESESVLFRENERFVFRAWLQRMWQDRGSTASVSEATLCGALILVALFFGRLANSEINLRWETIVYSTIVIQIGLILGPCLVMATMLTRSLREALRIHAIRWTDVLVCIGLAIVLHPTYVQLVQFVQTEYALGDQTKQALAQMDGLLNSIPLWCVIYILAVIPALCEELAFRGFIFGGLVKNNGVLRAILLSSLFFGLSHGVLQQSITAGILGIGLGIIAWRSGSVLPGIALHMTHNALSMLVARLAVSQDSMPTFLTWAFEWSGDGWAYSSTWTTYSCFLAILGFTWFFVRKPYDRRKTPRTQTQSEKWKLNGQSVATAAKRNS